MTPRYAAYGLCAVLAVLALMWGLGSWQQRQGAQAEVQAAIHQGEANAHQAQAQTSDAAYEDLKAKHADSQAALGRLTAERVALLKRLESERQARLDAESAHPAQAGPVPDVRDEIIAKDAEVIQAQAYFIEAQKAEIAVLVVSRDEWKATAEARERQAMAQAEATRAWKQAVTTSRWQGRGEGAVVGALLGLLGGKL